MPADPEPPAEEVLDAVHLLPRWMRVSAFGAGILLLGYLGIRELHTAGGGTAAPGASGAASQQNRPPFGRPGVGPRLTRALGCGPDLPPVQVRSTSGDRSTHLTVLVGGRGLHRVDFDTGHAVRLRSHPRLLPTEWFGALARAGGTTYVTTSGLPCEIVNTRVLAVHGDRTVVASLAPSSAVVSDESSAWVVRDPPHVLAPLAGGHRVPLPPGFAPVAATRGQVVGYLVHGLDPDEIGTVDVRTGRIGSPPGAFGAVIAAGHGRVYWLQRPSSDEVHSAALRSGFQRSYRLPTVPAESAGAVSADGRYLALVVRHAVTDLRTGAHPRLDGQIALLDLRTGRLHLVPGIALPLGYRPTLAFAVRDWLVIAYERGGLERLVAWRPGLRSVICSPFHGATSPAAPPVAIMTG